MPPNKFIAEVALPRLSYDAVLVVALFAFEELYFRAVPWNYYEMSALLLVLKLFFTFKAVLVF